MAEVTWLGDEDPSVQIIEQYGHKFVKGVPTKVGDNDPNLRKFRAMTVFSLDKKAEAVASEEPVPVDPETGTELAAVKAALDERGIKYDGRSGLSTLRAKLAEG